MGQALSRHTHANSGEQVIVALALSLQLIVQWRVR